jgi:AraC-like DNA-binding protein
LFKNEADRAIRESRANGFIHHSYELEHRRLISLLLGGRRSLSDLEGLTMELYADVLGPTRIRSIKNGLICLVTVISRAAIEYGVETELSFSLSDFFINEIERKNTKVELKTLLEEMLDRYAELVKQEQYRGYSPPITRAMRYIHRNLFASLRVADAAAQAGLNPRYFSARFKAEVGESPSQYIKARKMEEAKSLLQQPAYPVGDAAEALGYCTLAHFSHEFKQLFGISPREFARCKGQTPGIA